MHSKKYFIINCMTTEVVIGSYKDQPALRSLHPLVTRLMSRTNDWYSNIGRGKYTGLIFIYLKRALATVNQDIQQKEL